MNTLIFLFGLFVSLLVAGGIALTLLEFRRFERMGDQRAAGGRFPL